jgi:hypothetical protein
MKTTLLILITSVALVTGCASAPQPSTSCVLLKFPSKPSPQVVEVLAHTQPGADAPAIREWFATGQTGFVLSSTHTNAIATAAAAGATVTTIHSTSGGLHLNNFRKR